LSDHHLLARFRRSERSSTTKVPERSYAPSADDRHLRMRGVPILAEGISGAMHRSRADHEVLKRDGRWNV
jgi:hypothetical protein